MDSQNTLSSLNPLNQISTVSAWSEAWEILSQRFQLNLSDIQKNKIESFYLLLREANQLMNLTKLDSLPDFLTFHLIDTAMLINLIRQMELSKQIKCLDLGSGCGVPGILLHVFLMSDFGIHTTLCESRLKRADYLKKVISSLSLEKEIKVEAERSESLLGLNLPRSKQTKTNKLKANKFQNNFDLVTARAFAKPIETLKIANLFLNSSGGFLSQTSTCLVEDNQYQQTLMALDLEIKMEEEFELADKKRFVALIQNS